ncbi:MAG: NAD(P)H-binding protein [Candidatus Saccharimonadales bacterium]
MRQQVTVFGANGKVGSLIVEELLGRDYKVVAFVHNQSALKQSDQLSIVQGDIYQAIDVEKALDGSEMVISALGSWGTPKKDILATGMSFIIPGMKKRNITKIISLTGADARAKGDKLSLLHRISHIGISIIGHKVLFDGEKHIRLLEESKLDWTVVRSPIMSSSAPVTDMYNLGDRRPAPWKTISRQLVVLSMVDLLENHTWTRRSPFLGEDIDT